MALSAKFINEGLGSGSARIVLYDGKKAILVVGAKIGDIQGADGEYYPAVEFFLPEQQPRKIAVSIGGI